MARKAMTDDPYLEELFSLDTCRPEKQKPLVFDGSFNAVFAVSVCGTKAEVRKRSFELSERFSVGRGDQTIRTVQGMEKSAAFCYFEVEYDCRDIDE